MARRFKKTPAHIQLSQELRNRVLAERLPPGERFLTVREIAEHYSVSLVTAHKSVRQLVDEKIVHVHPSKGCFVAGNVHQINQAATRSIVTILQPAARDGGMLFARVLDDFLKGVQHSIAAPQVQVELYPANDALHHVKTLTQADRQRGDNRIYILNSADAPIQRFFADSDLKAIVAGGLEEGIDLPAVQMDEYANMTTAMTLLLGKGHRRIFFLERNNWNAGNDERREAFTHSLKRRDPQISNDEADRLIVQSPLVEEQALAEIRRILTGARERIAIVCGADSLAAWCIRAAYHLGLKIPDELALVSLQGTHLAEHLTPKLSAVPAREYEIGITVGRWIKMIEAGERLHNRLHTIAASLVERETT